MRFKRKPRISHEIITREWFAILPIHINDEWRWLERVKVEGYWWHGWSGTWYWEPKKFIDNP
jgi:hypothetical protein